MGKDATNTLFAENQVVDQRLGSDISGQQFKGEQFGAPLKQEEQPAGGFHGDKWHDHSGEKSKNAQSSQIMEDANAGGFHGDKWKDLSGTEQFKGEQLNGRRPSLTNSMGDEFPADQFKDQSVQLNNQLRTETILRPQRWSELPPTHASQSFPAEPQMNPIMDNHFQRDMQFSGQDRGVQGDIIKNDTREVRHEMLAELKSHAGHSDHIVPSEIHEGTTIHDGRLHAGMMPDGRTVTPQMAISQDMHDGTLRDATIHDGRTRTVHDATPVMEANPLDKLPLAERIIAGVHAGDPLSFGSPNKDAGNTKKDKKLKKKGFGADEHFKNDKGLIPHEHLKKDEPVLAHEHLSGGAILQKEDSFKANEPIMEGDAHRKSSFKKEKKNKLKKEKHFENDAHLNKNVNIVDNMQLNRDAGLSKDLDFKDSQFHKDSEFSKDSILARDNLNKQDAYLMTGDHLNKDLNHDSSSLNDEAAGKTGLKDKVRSKKEKLKQKMGMKKEEQFKTGESHIEESAPPKGHEIATIKIPGIESGDRAAQDMVNHQAKAKKELNAELKEHAGHADHIAPSEILSHGMGQMNLHENRAVDTQIISHKGSGAMADQITRDQVLAKSELNAEIKNHAGDMGLMPSEISGSQFQSKDFQSSEFQNKDFQNDQFQSKDLMQGNQFQNKDFESSQFQHKDMLDSNQFQSNQFQNKDFLDNQSNLKQFEGDRLTGFGATGDAMNKNNILAKKDLNDEIKGLGQEHIMPSEILHKQGEFESQMHGEKLTGFSGSNEAMKGDNILAKKEVLAEIKQAGMGHDQILPSELLGSSQNKDFQGQDFQGKDFQSKDFQGKDFQSKDFQSKDFQSKDFQGSNAMMGDNILAKKEVLAEIKQAGMGHDQTLPSELLGSSQGQDFQGKDFQNNLQGNQFQNFPSKEQEFENTAEFQNQQFEKNNEYMNDKPGGLGAMFKDEVMREHIQAKKEVNAELKEVALGHSDQLLPSEISGAVPAGGVTVIHDGRDIQGSDRLKGEMDYDLAKESIEKDSEPHMSLTQRLAAMATGAATVVKDAVTHPGATVAAVKDAVTHPGATVAAVKETLSTYTK